MPEALSSSASSRAGGLAQLCGSVRKIWTQSAPSAAASSSGRWRPRWAPTTRLMAGQAIALELRLLVGEQPGGQARVAVQQRRPRQRLRADAVADLVDDGVERIHGRTVEGELELHPRIARV